MSWSLWSSWLVGFFQALKRLNLRSQFEPKKRGVVSCWSFEVLNSLCYVSFKVFCEFRLSHDLSFVCCVSCSSYCETWWPLDWHPPRPSTRHPRHRFPSHHVLLGRHILEGRRSWRGTTVTQVMQGKDQVFFLVIVNINLFIFRIWKYFLSTESSCMWYVEPHKKSRTWANR